MTLLINILLGFYLFVAILMILVILMQRPKSEGLGAAFGGGVTENIFGAQTTNVLTKITSWLTAIFFLLSFGLSVLYANKASTKSNLQLIKDLPTATPAPPTPTPGPTAAGAMDTSPAPSPGQSPKGGMPGTDTSATPGSSSPTPSAKTEMTPSPVPSPATTTPAPSPSISAASPEPVAATPAAHRRRRR